MTEHDLKVAPEHFQALWDGDKTAADALAAVAALQSQIDQERAAALLAQADAETLADVLDQAAAALLSRPIRTDFDRQLAEQMRARARTAHPGQALAGEVAAARAREAGLKLAADQYSESRDQWMLKAKAAIQRGAADHAIAAAARPIVAIARRWHETGLDCPCARCEELRAALATYDAAEQALLAAVAGAEQGVSE